MLQLKDTEEKYESEIIIKSESPKDCPNISQTLVLSGSLFDKNQKDINHKLSANKNEFYIVLTDNYVVIRYYSKVQFFSYKSLKYSQEIK